MYVHVLVVVVQTMWLKGESNRPTWLAIVQNADYVQSKIKILQEIWNSLPFFPGHSRLVIVSCEKQEGPGGKIM